MSEQIFTDQNFADEVLKSDQLVVVDFWAQWCGPCRVQGPIIEVLAKDKAGQGVKIGKLNVDDNPVTAQQYQVMSIPTLIFYKGGRPAYQVSGVQQREAIEKKIEELAG